MLCENEVKKGKIQQQLVDSPELLARAEMTIQVSNLAVLEIMFSIPIVMPTFDLQSMTELMFNSSYIGSNRLLEAQKQQNIGIKVKFQSIPVSYTFNVTNITNSSISVQFNFVEPIKISQQRISDQVVVTLNNISMFTSVDGQNVWAAKTQLFYSIPRLKL